MDLNKLFGSKTGKGEKGFNGGTEKGFNGGQKGVAADGYSNGNVANGPPNRRPGDNEHTERHRSISKSGVSPQNPTYNDNGMNRNQNRNPVNENSYRGSVGIPGLPGLPGSPGIGINDGSGGAGGAGYYGGIGGNGGNGGNGATIRSQTERTPSNFPLGPSTTESNNSNFGTRSYNAIGVNGPSSPSGHINGGAVASQTGNYDDNEFLLLVRGVPMQSNENCLDIYRNIAVAIGYRLDMIPRVDASRFELKTTHVRRNAPLVLKFANIHDKSEFYRHSSNKNDLKLKDIGFQGDATVFITYYTN
jgi:hypothetical protein